MRILWCTHTSAGFDIETGGYNGSGWISSLLEVCKQQRSIEIGVAFLYHKDAQPVERDNVMYFPVKRERINVAGKLKTLLGDYSAWKKADDSQLSRLYSVIDSYKPDVIHVWGTETCMGLISARVKIPVILHIQGLLNPYKNALLPPGVSRGMYLLKDGLLGLPGNINGLNYWEYKAQREIEILKSCKFFFGRTHWDKAVSKLYSPHSSYFYCSEMLRAEFYTDNIWNGTKNEAMRIISTISSPLYKGLDMILKTAEILSKQANVDFEWLVVGVDNSRFVEKNLNISAKDVNVKLLGVKNALQIKQLELQSDIYFHPSYIDNSPNSVCEAQMLGMPVVTTNSGGLASIVKDGITGWLVPCNEPHVAAAVILDVFSVIKDEINKRSEEVRRTASERHSPHNIVRDIINVYNQIIVKI